MKLTLHLAALLLPTAAVAAVTCPATVTLPLTPPERLINVAVWSAALHEPMYSVAPPSLVPDTTHLSDAVLTSTWRLSTYPGERSYLYCAYIAQHFLLFDVTGLATCTGTIDPYTPGATLISASTFTATCR